MNKMSELIRELNLALHHLKTFYCYRVTRFGYTLPFWNIARSSYKIELFPMFGLFSNFSCVCFFFRIFQIFTFLFLCILNTNYMRNFKFLGLRDRIIFIFFIFVFRIFRIFHFFLSLCSTHVLDTKFQVSRGTRSNQFRFFNFKKSFCFRIFRIFSFFFLFSLSITFMPNFKFLVLPDIPQIFDHLWVSESVRQKIEILSSDIFWTTKDRELKIEIWTFGAACKVLYIKESFIFFGKIQHKYIGGGIKSTLSYKQSTMVVLSQLGEDTAVPPEWCSNWSFWYTVEKYLL